MRTLVHHRRMPFVLPGRILRLLALDTLAVLLVVHAAPASATGFFINQQSVKGLGRVDAGNSAAADELGTIFFNPAGLNEFWSENPGGDRSASIGVNLIIPRATQHDTGSVLLTPAGAIPYGGRDSRNPTDPTPVPNLYFAMRLDDRDSLGLGVNVPFGLRTQLGNDWYGRYDAIEASLRTINVSLVGAHRFGEALSVGGGIDGQYARTTLTTAVPGATLTPETDARVSTRGDAYTAGFNVGLLYSFDRDDRIGFHYRSGMKHHIKGSSEFSGFQGDLQALNGNVGARADLNLPAVATAGVRLRASDSLVLMGDVQWYDWSTFDEVRIRFDDGRPDGVRVSRYRDTWGVAIGGEHHVEGSALTTRCGIHFDQTPTVDEFRDTTVPDSDHVWLGVGATYRARNGLEWDVAYNHVFFRDTRTAVVRPLSPGVAVQVNGAVSTVVDTIALDVRWRF